MSYHFNLEKERLRRLIEDRSQPVYAYVMSSLMLVDGNLMQWGTGPNLDGGCITLCTCKHRMRTSLPPAEWPGKWIAGFSSIRCGGRHWLFYLGQIREAYASQSELWHALPVKTRQAKSAKVSRQGDLYEPKGKLDFKTAFNPANYHPPLSGHRHHPGGKWRIDIDYRLKKLKRHGARRPSLLVADPEFSFVWRTPSLYVDARWRQRNYVTLHHFLQDLKEDRLTSDGKASRSIACRC
jgi:hypothetical protein